MKKMILIVGLIASIPLATQATPKNDTLEHSIEGKITYKSGNVVKVQILQEEEMPVNGTEGELSKYFETELFGASVTGWLAIGKMKVTGINGDIVSFMLLEELSVVTENGVKKDHFVVGNRVKFLWKVAVSSDE